MLVYLGLVMTALGAVMIGFDVTAHVVKFFKAQKEQNEPRS